MASILTIAEHYAANTGDHNGRGTSGGPSADSGGIEDTEVLQAGGWILPSKSAADCGAMGEVAERCISRSDLSISLITRTQTLSELTDITQELWQAADEPPCHQLSAGHLPVRLLCMSASGLDGAGFVPGLLFDREERGKQARLDAVAVRGWITSPR
jgi:hypothetical protein